MTNVDKLIEDLTRIYETKRPVTEQTLLMALIQIADAVKELQELNDVKENNKFYQETSEEENGTR